MRVLLVSSHGADRTYGGTERYVHDLAEVLTARGHQVDLLSAFPVRDPSGARTVALHDADWRDDRIRRYRNHAGDWIAAPWPRVRALLQELRPDLLHTSNLPGISTGIWGQASRLGIPVIHTLHDYHLLCPRTSLIKADGSPCDPSPLLCGLRTRRLAHWAPAVRVAIGVSAHVLDRHQGFFGLQTERRVIQAPLTALTGVVAPAPAGPLTLGYLGALTVSKGVDLLLEAAPTLAEAGLTVRIAGDGPLREAVRAASGVKYAGRLEAAEVGSFIQACDLGLITSRWEEPGLTYVLLEWLAGGRPVLSTRRGGLAEAVAVGGVASFDGSVEGLVAGVQELRQPQRWRALVAALPAGDFDDLDRWGDDHLAAYEAALPREEASGPSPPEPSG
jgi:glycosyltransferase involved in cell wall biosynthesis